MSAVHGSKVRLPLLWLWYEYGTHLAPLVEPRVLLLCRRTLSYSYLLRVPVVAMIGPPFLLMSARSLLRSLRSCLRLFNVRLLMVVPSSHSVGFTAALSLGGLCLWYRAPSLTPTRAHLL